jgi:cation diffusion facilitator CzcD-associated flavoprotein CzcO
MADEDKTKSAEDKFVRAFVATLLCNAPDSPTKEIVAMSVDQYKSPAPADQPHVEVLIVGAGVSGIGAACRLTRERPGTSYAVLEARQAIGGTWDLFRYPGVRSDTDMYTYSYPFKPWTADKTMGNGEDIRRYLAEAAAEHGVDRHISFGTTVLGASWSSLDARWTVRAEVDGRPATWTCSFLYLCAGYYDHQRGHQPDFTGLGDYTGTFVHPQFWPRDLDYAGKKVVVIGSGATAVTLVPAMARSAARVTMLQRSPTYVASLPSEDTAAKALRRWLPANAAHRIARAKNALLFQGLYAYSRALPKSAAARIRRGALSYLADPHYVDTHFTPSYKPWDQRVAFAPDGDFFQAIRDGHARVVTDHIDRFVPEGIRLASGELLEADVVVSATGLSMKPFGALDLRIDGASLDLADTLTYRAVMLSGVPNLAFSFGYTNASWTLGADMSARFVCRLLDHMDRHGYAAATPAVEPAQKRLPFLTELKSGYVQRGIDRFPRQGKRSPWRGRRNYLLDAATARTANITLRMRFCGHATTTTTATDTRTLSCAA